MTEIVVDPIDPSIKPWRLQGSCHCGKITLEMDSYTPYPYMICHCKADTKTAGIMTTNIMAEASSLIVKGRQHISVYQRKTGTNDDGSDKLSTHQRFFCKHCASYLYAFDERWRQWIYPFASCIDTDLPIVKPEDQVHIFLESKLAHVQVPVGVPESHIFQGYPDGGSIYEWHKKRGLYGIKESTSSESSPNQTKEKKINAMTMISTHLSSSASTLNLDVVEQIAAYLHPSRVHSLSRLSRAAYTRFHQPSYTLACENIANYTIQQRCPKCQSDPNHECDKALSRYNVCKTTLMNLKWDKMGLNYVAACISLCDFGPELLEVLFPLFRECCVLETKEDDAVMSRETLTLGKFSTTIYGTINQVSFWPIFNLTTFNNALSKTIRLNDQYDTSIFNHACIKWLAVVGDLKTLQYLHHFGRLSKTARSLALVEACHMNYVEMVSWLLEIVDITATFQSYESTLGQNNKTFRQCWSRESGRRIGDVGDSPEMFQETVTGVTAFLGALCNRNEDMASLVIMKSDFVKADNIKTLLQFACCGRNTKFVGYLLDHPKMQSRILHDAINTIHRIPLEEGSHQNASFAEVTRMLVNDRRLILTPADESDYFLEAVSNNDLGLVKFWIEERNVNPLVFDCCVIELVADNQAGTSDVLKYLLAIEGMNPSARNNIALHTAVLAGAVETVDILLSSDKLQDSRAPLWGWELEEAIYEYAATTLPPDESIEVMNGIYYDEPESCFDVFFLAAVKLSIDSPCHQQIVKLLVESGRVNPCVMYGKALMHVYNESLAKYLIETAKVVQPQSWTSVMVAASRFSWELFERVVNDGQFKSYEIPLERCMEEAFMCGIPETAEKLLLMAIGQIETKFMNGGISVDVTDMLCQKGYFSQKSANNQLLKAVLSGWVDLATVLVKYVDASGFKNAFLAVCGHLRSESVSVFFEKGAVNMSVDVLKEGLEKLGSDANDQLHGDGESNETPRGTTDRDKTKIEMFRYLDCQLRSFTSCRKVDEKLFDLVGQDDVSPTP
ncbi:hypothetical protein HDU76_013534 [Blyttiomyces sp. JEL0837]|nr:hypothetical protein HDU76_013534 [Blyttiomyces sp. JEL0837]